MHELAFFKKFIHTMLKGDNLNWHERNSGNMTYRMTTEDITEAKKYFQPTGETQKMDITVSNLVNEYFVVTAAGKYFMNALIDTDEVIGIVQISADGTSYQIVYGFDNNNLPTSELPAHLLIHNQSKVLDADNRTVYHCHPTNLNTMTYVHNYDSYEFTAKLWKYATEASVFVPKGVGLLHWMMPGSVEIGAESSKLLTEFNIVCWVHHGVFAVGYKPDETLGMVHVAEKAAEIFIKINSMNIPEINTIKKEEIVDLVTTFGIDANQKVIEKL